MFFYYNPTSNAAYFDLGLSVFLLFLLVYLMKNCIKNMGIIRQHLSDTALILVLSKASKPSLYLSLPCMAVIGFFWYRFLAFLSYINALDVGAIGFVVVCGGLSLMLVYFTILFVMLIIYGKSLFPPSGENP